MLKIVLHIDCCRGILQHERQPTRPEDPPHAGRDCSEIAEDFAAIAPGRHPACDTGEREANGPPGVGVETAFNDHEVYVDSGMAFDA